MPLVCGGAGYGRRDQLQSDRPLALIAMAGEKTTTFQYEQVSRPAHCAGCTRTSSSSTTCSASSTPELPR